MSNQNAKPAPLAQNNIANSNGDFSEAADLATGQSLGSEDDNVVDLSVFVQEITDRLAIVGSIPSPEAAATEYQTVDMMQVLIFRLADDLFAISTKFIEEIITDHQITPVPGLPSWLAGVAGFRGEVLSAVRLPQFLRLGNEGTSSSFTMLAVQFADQLIGLLVEEVDVTYSFPVDQVRETPMQMDDQLAQHLDGVFEHREECVHLLNCERLLLGPEMQQFS